MMNHLKFNKSDYKFILIYFIAASVWLLFRWNMEQYTMFEMLTGLPGFIAKNLILLFIFRWLINEYLVVKKQYWIFILLAFLAYEIIGFLDMFRDYYTSDHEWPLPAFWIMLIDNFNRSANDSALFIGLLLGKKYYENKLDNIELQNNQKELELRILRSQFDPHFLYNSLNTIDALIDYSPKEKVKEYISHLAALYRYLIHTKDEDIVSVEDEIELAKNYFYVIETRFENDYDFRIEMKTYTINKYLPKGSLLTVLENVVKHNTASDGKTIKTKIVIESNFIKISNSLSTHNHWVESMGTGLKNLKKRYELLSDNKIEINQTDNKFEITLPLLNLIS